MKQLLTGMLLVMACVSGCASAAPHTVELIGADDPGMEATEMAVHAREFESMAATGEQPAFDIHTDVDLLVRLDLTDGAFYEIPGISREELESAPDKEDVIPLIAMHLDHHGVKLSADLCEKIFFINDERGSISLLPVFIGHYQDFDLIYIRYTGYRGSYSGNLFIFENGWFKDSFIGTGSVDFQDCFREINDAIWLVVATSSGGSGLGVRGQGWISLTGNPCTTELIYTSYLGTNNYTYVSGIDFSLTMEYNVLEESLYVNEEGIPVLKVRWQKDVYDGDGIISLTANGYADHNIQPLNDAYDMFDLSCGELTDGLEDQLETLIQSGTEEQRHIATQIVESFME